MKLFLFIIISLNSMFSSAYTYNKLEKYEEKNVQIIIKIDGSNLDSAVVEINDLKFISDSNGVVNLKIETGEYEVKVVKGEYIELFDVVINDKTGFIILNIKK